MSLIGSISDGLSRLLGRQISRASAEGSRAAAGTLGRDLLMTDRAVFDRALAQCKTSAEAVKIADQAARLDMPRTAEKAWETADRIGDLPPALRRNPADEYPLPFSQYMTLSVNNQRYLEGAYWTAKDSTQLVQVGRLAGSIIRGGDASAQTLDYAVRALNGAVRTDGSSDMLQAGIEAGRLADLLRKTPPAGIESGNVLQAATEFDRIAAEARAKVKPR